MHNHNCILYVSWLETLLKTVIGLMDFCAFLPMPRDDPT